MLAETLAMIGRLWGALYRHEVARMPWCICYVIVYTSAPELQMQQNMSWNCAKILFTSLILEERLLAINNQGLKIVQYYIINRDNHDQSKKAAALCTFNLVYNTWVSARLYGTYNLF